MRRKESPRSGPNENGRSRKDREDRKASPSPEPSDPEADKEREGDAQEVETKSGPPALSFNAKISPDMAEYEKPSEDELEEMKRTDPRLKSGWCIWEMLQKGKKGADYDKGSVVATFSTVKGFWKHWNHLPQPSELLDGKKFVRETPEGRSIVECLMIFREGVLPEWEDPLNATGGHFELKLNGKVGGAQIDEYWNNAVLGMVTGAIKPADMITGVRLVDKLGLKEAARQHIRLEIWYSNHKDTEKVDELQKNVEKCMATKVDGTVPDRPPKMDRKKH